MQVQQRQRAPSRAGREQAASRLLLGAVAAEGGVQWEWARSACERRGSAGSGAPCLLCLYAVPACALASRQPRAPALACLRRTPLRLRLCLCVWCTPAGMGMGMMPGMGMGMGNPAMMGGMGMMPGMMMGGYGGMPYGGMGGGMGGGMIASGYGGGGYSE